MKIVFLHHANVCRGGIERMLQMRANMLAEQYGAEVVMLTYEQNGEPYPYPLSRKVCCVDLGVRLYSAYQVPYPERYFRKQELRRQLSAALKTFLEDYQPDIVTCTDKDTYEQEALFKARGRGKSPKLLIEAHTGMVDHKMQVRNTGNYVKRLLALRDLYRLKRSVSKFDLLIALTEDDARCWSGCVRTVVIPNYLPQFPTLPAVNGEVHKRVIAVGRLNIQKGQDLLLSAWREVERRHPDWHLDIFGDGNDLEYLSRLRTDYGLAQVTIHPTTPDIYSEYMRSDFLVCSSRWESFGVVLIEAMACGIPVVSFDCDNGPRNIITDGENGLLVENGNVSEMAKKICWMMEHAEQRQQMGVKARQGVSRYLIDHILTQYVDIYHTMKKKKSK